MHLSSLFGLIFGAGVMYAALHATASDMSFFLDFHGILIVCGGTAAAASLSFPLNQVLLLTKVFIQRVLGGRKVDYQGVVTQMIELNKKVSLGVTGLKESIPNI